ncbi:hypothetical protein S7711_03622 [Stachybotrys chartarum IBT 7711]|uniref:Heterokaryon incompatibility domain-containing protein n=1 Tax=Stachybotrys chartarum (strain CBS 109288 / IBT 7711) TaxID=1280523 RepID=A0A084AGX7_STACB|nr:hypothetical protein S7711_03622 [Stachybotrys chartarum IBT 7711]KFA50066.1 hypothetical protein S40293_08605 [Stachybotrys chartarum IBT 40293]
MLCAVCERMDLADLRDWEGDMQDAPHHKSLAELKENAKSCDLCQIILNGFVEKLDKDDVDQLVWEARDAQIIWRGRAFVDENTDWEPTGLYMITVRCDKAGPRGRVRLTPYVDMSVPSQRVVPPNVVMGRAARPAKESLGVLREWMAKCAAEHSGCCPSSTPLPTRVVDVGDSHGTAPRLKVSDGEVGAYITLSHCWGKTPEKVTRTTTKTLEQHLQAIPMSTLPKTFREAIEVARAVGVRYLWIDSLCIVQDDGLDWQRESAVMGDIYHNSFLTIAASGSPDSGGGCFLHQDSGNHPTIKCSVLNETTGEKIQGRVHLRRKIKNFEELATSVLHSRAWVLQERFLSPRIVHFDTDQMLWECRESRWSQDEIPSEAYSMSSNRLWNEQFNFTDLEDRPDFEWDWYAVIENFTKRGITKSFDKLPALSGLAKIFESKLTGRYVGGLWERYLPFGLLWRRHNEWLTFPEAGYRAPSWSWAALDGHIGMISQAEVDTGVGPKVVYIRDIEATVSPSTLDPRGQLQGGSVILTGPLKMADPRDFEDTMRTEEELEREITVTGWKSPTKEWLRDRGEIVGMATYDRQSSTKTGEPVYCLQISSKPNTKQKWYGILLNRSAEENVYTRVGMCEGWLDRPGQVNAAVTWFDDAITTRLTII